MSKLTFKHGQSKSTINFIKIIQTEITKIMKKIEFLINFVENLNFPPKFSFLEFLISYHTSSFTSFIRLSFNFPVFQFLFSYSYFLLKILQILNFALKSKSFELKILKRSIEEHLHSPILSVNPYECYTLEYYLIISQGLNVSIFHFVLPILRLRSLSLFPTWSSLLLDRGNVGKMRKRVTESHNEL